MENSDKAIKNFYKEKGIQLEREVESLLLNNKELNDDNIKCISQIKFNQLKEIDLSGNEITSIEPLCYIKLPFLEFLNLSNNKIKNIEPLEDINLTKLKYLFIQNNQIEDIKVLIDLNFPTFEILRIENNKIDKTSDSLKELVNLYNKKKKILITEEKEIDEFKKIINYKYNENNEMEAEPEPKPENEEEIKKSKEEKETKEGELILKYLFIIIPSDNKIRKLKLKGNDIKDPSILNRIQFDYLEELDLGYNKITNLKFLRKMKAKNLKTLYLNNNKINNFSLLDNIKKDNFFYKLECVTFNNNNCESDESR